MNNDQNIIASQQPVNPLPVSPKGNKKLIFSGGIVVIFILIFSWVMLVKKNEPRSTSGAVIFKKVQRPTLVPTVVVVRDSSLKLSPNRGSFGVGSPFKVSILLGAPRKSLDGVDVIIRYDPELFEITVDKGTAFPQYPRSKVDEVKGEIVLSGYNLEAKPTPILSDSLFGTLTLRGKKAGQGKLEFVWRKGQKNLSNIIENGTSRTLLSEVVNGEYTLNP